MVYTFVGAADEAQDALCRLPGGELRQGVRALRQVAPLRQLRDAEAVAQAAGGAAAGQAQLLRDDQIHLQPGQPEADDEHAEGEVAQHPVRGLSRL